MFGRDPIFALLGADGAGKTTIVRAFAENQRVTPIVDVIRALLSGQPVGNDIWGALAWCVGILLVAYVFAIRAYKKRV